MRVLLSIAVLSLLPTSTAVADRRPETAKLRGELIEAINQRNVAEVRSRVVLPLRLRGLRFDAAGCTQFTGKQVDVLEYELTDLVGCLADLGVKHLAGKHDVWVNAVVGPGVPLVFHSGPVEPQVTTLYSYGLISDSYVIEPVTFTSHIKKFKRDIVPAAAMKKAIDLSPTDYAAAKVHLCVDGRGKVTNVLATALDDAYKAYEKVVAKTTRAWSIKPFEIGGTGVAACTTLTVGYPADRMGIPLQMQLPAPPPPPPPSSGEQGGVEGGVVGDRPQNVPPTLLEGSRISGEKAIVPDDKTKTEIQLSKKDKVIASFKLCVDTSGAVSTVKLLKSSGYAAYDAKIIREMNKWAYRPYQVNGKAVPVCTAVTFIYSQR